jgi:hypothetical protein
MNYDALNDGDKHKPDKFIRWNGTGYDTVQVEAVQFWSDGKKILELFCSDKDATIFNSSTVFSLGDIAAYSRAHQFLKENNINEIRNI